MRDGGRSHENWTNYGFGNTNYGFGKWCIRCRFGITAQTCITARLLDGAGKFSGKQSSLRDNVARREISQGTYTFKCRLHGNNGIEGQPGGTAHFDIFWSLAMARKGI